MIIWLQLGPRPVAQQLVPHLFYSAVWLLRSLFQAVPCPPQLEWDVPASIAILGISKLLPKHDLASQVQLARTRERDAAHILRSLGGTGRSLTHL